MENSESTLNTYREHLILLKAFKEKVTHTNTTLKVHLKKPIFKIFLKFRSVQAGDLLILCAIICLSDPLYLSCRKEMENAFDSLYVRSNSVGRPGI